MNIQNYLRKEVKRLKWEEDIKYKTIAEELLEMNYNAFINWLRGDKNLSREKIKILEDYINIMK